MENPRTSKRLQCPKLPSDPRKTWYQMGSLVYLCHWNSSVILQVFTGSLQVCAWLFGISHGFSVFVLGVWVISQVRLDSRVSYVVACMFLCSSECLSRFIDHLILGFLVSLDYSVHFNLFVVFGFSAALLHIGISSFIQRFCCSVGTQGSQRSHGISSNRVRNCSFTSSHCIIGSYTWSSQITQVVRDFPKMEGGRGDSSLTWSRWRK